MIRGTLVLAAALAVAAPLGAQPATLPADFDAYVARAMREFAVPGVGLAIVKDGRVVLARGYGVKRLGEREPVTARTRFGIASLTKAFTATLLAQLVEEKKIEWDAPVVRYLPWFAMSDPMVTHQMTVRDLLVHRSGLGLGAGDLLWWPATTFERRDIVRRLRDVPLETSFRSQYAYDNLLYLAAGEVIEAVTGKRWEEVVRERLLVPLGMTGTAISFAEAKRQGDVAWPHAEVEGTVRPVLPYESDNGGAAAALTANAEDMAKWMIAQLDSGRAGGRRLWSAASARQMWALVTPIAPRDPPPELPMLRRSFHGYGLGWNVLDLRGRKMVQHSGGLPGYVSLLTMLPDEKLGVAVLTSQESGGHNSAITYRVLDHFLGDRPHDYVAAYGRVRARSDSAKDATLRRAAAQRDSTSGPSLALAKYAGTYTDAWYGDVTIAMERGRLVLRMTRTPGLVGDLQHWQHDTFIARWRDREMRADAYVTFALNPDGTIDQAKMQAVSPDTDFSFDFHHLLLKPKR